LIDGIFVNVHTVGRFCYEDDDFLLSSAVSQGNGSNVYRPFRDATINSLKHRLLVFLFKRAKHISDAASDPYELRKFYQHFDQVMFSRMKQKVCKIYFICD
jgi:de-etiolated-1